ncbi:hypothetical protein BH18ACT4_BH18ACT4_10590 [soil metagenome]
MKSFVCKSRMFSGRATSVADCRHWLADVLGGDRDDVLRDRAVLLLSELATNAVVHARTDYRVTATVGADRLRVEVSDGSPTLPEAGTTALDSPGGRGIRLVDTVSESWGVEPSRTGKAVWFECGLVS